MKIIYRAENLIDANLVKLALTDAGIHAFVNGEQLTGGVGQLPAMDLVSVMVSDRDVEQGLAIARRVDHDLSSGSFAIGEEQERAGPDIDPLIA